MPKARRVHGSLLAGHIPSSQRHKPHGWSTLLNCCWMAAPLTIGCVLSAIVGGVYLALGSQTSRKWDGHGRHSHKVAPHEPGTQAPSEKSPHRPRASMLLSPLPLPVPLPQPPQPPLPPMPPQSLQAEPPPPPLAKPSPPPPSKLSLPKQPQSHSVRKLPAPLPAVEKSPPALGEEDVRYGGLLPDSFERWVRDALRTGLIKSEEGPPRGQAADNLWAPDAPEHRARTAHASGKRRL